MTLPVTLKHSIHYLFQWYTFSSDWDPLDVFSATFLCFLRYRQLKPKCCPLSIFSAIPHFCFLFTSLPHVLLGHVSLCSPPFHSCWAVSMHTNCWKLSKSVFTCHKIVIYKVDTDKTSEQTELEKMLRYFIFSCTKVNWSMMCDYIYYFCLELSWSYSFSFLFVCFFRCSAKDTCKMFSIKI